MWCNNADGSRTGMNARTVTLRDGLGYLARCGGLRAQSLHLDQVHIWFRPSASIPTAQFTYGDSTAKSWRVETAQLLVRVKPGEQFTFYVVEPGDDDRTSSQPERSLTYSSALSLTPDVEGTEDYWVRTYRPIRDIPVARKLDGVSELDIELLWPLLFQSGVTGVPNTVPDYRILRVILEFSVDH